FPAGFGYREFFPHLFASPAQFLEMTDGLLHHGYSDDDVRAILGGNFLRVASDVWR
ncbi:MAG TPA: membrane dipeptidase, partial [Candidatus Dormibacteraeota bacterium]|nr:membrane dipeptidase [Candidatus Dormibacteraeota bacterium]